MRRQSIVLVAVWQQRFFRANAREERRDDAHREDDACSGTKGQRPSTMRMIAPR